MTVKAIEPTIPEGNCGLTAAVQEILAVPAETPVAIGIFAGIVATEVLSEAQAHCEVAMFESAPDPSCQVAVKVIVLPTGTEGLKGVSTMADTWFGHVPILVTLP